MMDGWYTALGCRVLSDAIIRCETSEGVDEGHRIIVENIGNQSSDISGTGRDQTLSYQQPVVIQHEGAASSSATTSGGQPITITGDNFGPRDEAAPPSVFAVGAYGANVSATMRAQYITDCRVRVAAGAEL